MHSVGMFAPLIGIVRGIKELRYQAREWRRLRDPEVRAQRREYARRKAIRDAVKQRDREPFPELVRADELSRRIERQEVWTQAWRIVAGVCLWSAVTIARFGPAGNRLWIVPAIAAIAGIVLIVELMKKQTHWEREVAHLKKTPIWKYYGDMLEVVQRLRDYEASCRKVNPIPARDDLTAWEQETARIYREFAIQAIQPRIESALATGRWYFEIVILDRAGLYALHEIIGEEPMIVAVTEPEYDEMPLQYLLPYYKKLSAVIRPATRDEVRFVLGTARESHPPEGLYWSCELGYGGAGETFLYRNVGGQLDRAGQTESWVG